MLAVFKDAEDSAFKAYEAAAGGLWSDYDFAHTFDASLVEEVGSLSWPGHQRSYVPDFSTTDRVHDAGKEGTGSGYLQNIR